jgi:hypothetical protein
MKRQTHVKKHRMGWLTESSMLGRAGTGKGRGTVDEYMDGSNKTRGMAAGLISSHLRQMFIDPKVRIHLFIVRILNNRQILHTNMSNRLNF